MPSLQDQLQSWVDDTSEKMHRVVLYSILELQNRIKIRTPVDTGRLRANWIYSYGKPTTSTVGFNATSGAVVGFAGAQMGLGGPAFGGIHYLVNNLPYAMRIEYGFYGQDSLGRTYNQAGRKMVGLSVMEWGQIVDRSVKAVRSTT